MTIKITNDLTQIDYPRYERYKDSGVDWLGEIPEGWDTRRLKYVLSERNERSKTGEEPLLMVSQKYGLVIRADYHDKATVALSSIDSKIVHKNDLVFNKLKAHLGVFYKSEIDLKGIVSPDYAVYRSKAYIEDLKFLELLFKLPIYIQQFIIRATGVAEGLIRLYTSELFDLPVPIPPLIEQKKILEFIDNKFVQIDQAITLKQQQIAKLEEYKQIVIQNAVTKGLNPDVPMKDSGVDRIDKLPEHWEVKKFRFSFKFQRGLNITKDDLRDKGVLCLNYGEIHSKYGFELLPEHKLKYVDDKYTETNYKSLLNNGDFVFADTSEDIAGSGNFSYINGMMQVFAGYHTLIAKPIIDFDSRFVAYLLDSRAFRGQVQQRVKGVKVYSITQSILKSTYIWLPPIDEQVKIVQELDSEMKLINEAIQSYKTQIDRLKEYKTILINQAVTGKIKVS
jgi:type I restriction enzyme S subunit